MDISEGFQIEQPNIFVPWEISSEELTVVFSGHGLRRVVDNYFVIECISLGGLSHKLGFHFHPAPGGNIRFLEFFDNGCTDNASAFWLFQKHLEATFGKPTLTAPGDEGYPPL